MNTIIISFQSIFSNDSISFLKTTIALSTHTPIRNINFSPHKSSTFLEIGHPIEAG